MHVSEMRETLASQVLRRNPSIEEAPLHHELMLFNPANAQFFVLNRTMAFAWNRLENAASLEEIALEIEQSFNGVTIETAAKDVKKAVNDLLALGLIQPA
jgi:Coenzyme PQQ synthesis protein D (PqqD)